MATLIQPLKDLLAKLSNLVVSNQDNNPVKLNVRIWNNQIRYESDGKLYNFAKPAVFVEIVSPATFEVLGQGYKGCDINFRLHLAHEDYNAEGSFEDDLKIYELRDKVIALVSGFRPSGCGPLNSMSEQFDYEHSNVYHYIIDFICNFTDGTSAWQFNERPAGITGLEVDVTKGNSL